MLQHLAHTFRLHKNRLPNEDKMKFVTYGNIWLKCYINFLCIVAGVKRSSNVLANAIDDFYLFFNELKKIEDYLLSSMYSVINWVTISFTVFFCFNATILNSVLMFSSISIINCFVSLILITIIIGVVLLFVSKHINIFL